MSDLDRQVIGLFDAPPNREAAPAAGRYSSAIRRLRGMQISDHPEGAVDHSMAAAASAVNDDDDDEAVKIADQWETYDFDQEDWESIEEEASDDPDHCHMCSIGQSDKEQESNPQWQLFLKFLVESYHTMTRKALAVMAQGIFNKHFRPWTELKKPMRCRVIIDHIERHAPTVRISLESSNRTLNNCLMDLRSQLRQREKGTNRTRLNTQNINQYIKLQGFQNDVTARLSKLRSDTATVAK